MQDIFRRIQLLFLIFIIRGNSITTMLVFDYIGFNRVYARVYRRKNKQKAKKEGQAFYRSHLRENTKLSVAQVTFLLKTRLIVSTLNIRNYAKIK
jgi:hypothetical protein